jgi:TRAP-type mannitol/chloroaromatic compound transport system substrate-binding protein
VSGRVYERLGVVPQSIPGGEIYQALEKGTLDAVEFSSPVDDQKLGFYKVAPHYYYPGWHDGSAQLDLFVGIKAFEALPAEYRSIIQAAASHAHVAMQARYDSRNPAALKELVAQGTKLHRFPKEVMDAAFRESQALFGELAAANPEWKKVWSDYSKFRADQNLWFSFAEASMDSFLQAQKL